MNYPNKIFMTFCSIITAKKLTSTTPNAYHSGLSDGGGGTTLVGVRKKVLLFLFLTFFVSLFFNSTFAQSVPGFTKTCYPVNLGTFFQAKENKCPIEICIDQLITCNGTPSEIVRTCTTLDPSNNNPKEICLLTPTGFEGDCSITTYDIVVTRYNLNGQAVETAVCTSNAATAVQILQGGQGYAGIVPLTKNCDGVPNGTHWLYFERLSIGAQLTVNEQ